MPWIDISFVDMSPHTQWRNSNILQRDKLIGIQPTQKANRNERDPLIFPNIFFALFLKLLPIPLHQYFPLDIIKERLLYKSAISHPYPAMWVLSQKKGISKRKIVQMRNWLNNNFPLLNQISEYSFWIMHYIKLYGFVFTLNIWNSVMVLENRGYCG